MALPKPKTRSQIFWGSTAPYDIASAISGGGGSLASAARFFLNDPPLLWWGMLAVAGAVGTAGSQIMKARKSVSKEAAAAKDALVGLTGCLHTLNAVVGASAVNGFRSTVHAAEGDELIQSVEYVGDQRKKGTIGRKTPIHCGVIGKAYREKEAIAGSRETESHKDFIKQMIQVYAFDATRAKSLDPSTQSWIAAPLVQNGADVEGILYCDSTERDFFTEDRQRAIGYAAVGIAFFVAKAYPD